MSQHPNTRLTLRGREPLVSRAPRALPPRSPPAWPESAGRRTPPEVEERVAETRARLLLAPLVLQVETGVPVRTCARIVARRACAAR